MNVRSLGITSSLVVAAFAIACGGQARRSGFGTEADPTLDANDAERGGFASDDNASKGSDCAINNIGDDPEKDYDGDGYALKDDCNECNTGINKGAYDVPGNGIDEDCSGTADDEEVDCDGSLAIDTSDAFDGAKAIGLCKRASKDGAEWGVIEAKWVKPDGSSLGSLDGVGVLPDFGVNAPQAGESMLGLSSGVARAPGQPGYAPGISQHDMFSGYSSSAPDGYPKASPACPGKGTSGPANDGAGLQVKIRVPSNAQSFSYQQFFFTYEYPEFICSQYNDFFVAMLDPIPDGLPDGNIAFDQDGNPISVNNSLLQACKAGTHNKKTFDCPLGEALLDGTGFDNNGGEGHGSNGGTGWLTTTAPVAPGTVVTLRFTVWNQGDHALDSTVIIDDFKWSVEGAIGAETKPSGPN